MCSFNADYFPVCLPTALVCIGWWVSWLSEWLNEWWVDACISAWTTESIVCHLILCPCLIDFLVSSFFTVSLFHTSLLSLFHFDGPFHVNTQQQQIKNQVPIQIVVRVRGGHLQEDEPFRTLGFQKTKIPFFKWNGFYSVYILERQALTSPHRVASFKASQQ